MFLELSYLKTWLSCGLGALGMRRQRIGLEQPGKKEGRRRYALRSVDAAATRAQQNHGGQANEPQHFPI